MKSPIRRKTEEREKCTAYHEAGHAVIAAVVGIKIRYVTIVPTIKSAGQLASEKIDLREEAEPSPRKRLRIEKGAMIALAGSQAEGIYSRCTRRHQRSHSDYQFAACAAATIGGSARQKIAWLRWIGIRTGEFLENHWPAVKKIAEALILRKRLSGKEVDEIMWGLGDQVKFEPLPTNNAATGNEPSATMEPRLLNSETTNRERKEGSSDRPARSTSRPTPSISRHAAVFSVH